MHLTLIKPNIGRMEHSLYVDEGRMEPLQLGVLAALTPRDVEIALHDDRIESIPFDAPTDLVAITVETYTARRAYEIAAEYRARGVPVVMGGMHPTLIPEEVAPHADALFVGDAETGWAQVIADARQGVLRPRYDAPVGPPQPGTPTRRDIFAGKGYLPVTLMQFSRGCRFTCSFCAVSSYFDKTHYTRAVNEVVAEIQGLPRKQIIFFVDDNIVSDFAAAKALCRALIPLNVHWVSQGSIDMTRDPELMDLLVRSGCIGMVIGFESISRESLRDMRKAPNFVGGFDAYRPQLEILRDHGLQLWAAFTLGHDHDTRDSILETLAFAKENRFALAAFNILVPYPNTPLYRRLEAEGRLLYDGAWWLHPDYRFNYAAFRPRHMTPDELTELCWQCRAEYNELGFLIRRMFDLKTNLRTLTKLGVYLRYSPIFRREVFKKHGMRFGLH